MDRTLVDSEESTGFRSNWPWWRWVLTSFSALGLALSLYLGWHHLVGGTVIGCSGASPCEQVLSSRWSAVGGVVPVSALATGTYLAMLVASFFIGPATAAPDRRLALGAMLVLVGAAAGSAAWFMFVQKWMIGALCPYCMATHVTGVLLAVLVVWLARSVMGSIRTAGLAMIGLFLAGILAACQLGFTPASVYRGGQSEAKFDTIDPHAAPLVGSPDAPYIVTLLFDYKCPHCQKTHALLDEVIRRYDGKLAFVLCPAPLNPQCNPYISRKVEEFKDSCELAKVGLAVWTANREEFAAFDSWMFSPEPGRLWHPRTLDAARAKAVELVGQAKFNAARADPWVDRYLQTSVQLFGDTSKGGNVVPKIVFGSHWVTPEPNDANDLISILHESLSVPRP